VRINPDLRELHTERGGIYAQRSDHRRVIEAYNEALKLNSGDAASLSLRGGAHLNLGDFQRALSDYDSAIALEPRVAARGIARRH
jgi:tetratricopeptide (TPR) repeat protein